MSAWGVGLYQLLWSREFWRSIIRRRIPNLACIIFLQFSCKLRDWWYGSRNLTLRLHGYVSTFLAWIYLSSYGEWSSSYWRRDKLLVCSFLEFHSYYDYNDMFTATNFNLHLAHMTTKKKLCFQHFMIHRSLSPEFARELRLGVASYSKKITFK